MGQPDKKGSIQNSDIKSYFLVHVEHRITPSEIQTSCMQTGRDFSSSKTEAVAPPGVEAEKVAKRSELFQEVGSWGIFLARQKWIFWRADKKDHLKLAVTGTFVCDFDHEKQRSTFVSLFRLDSQKDET